MQSDLSMEIANLKEDNKKLEQRIERLRETIQENEKDLDGYGKMYKEYHSNIQQELMRLKENIIAAVDVSISTSDMLSRTRPVFNQL